MPATVLGDVYDRYGITWGDDYPHRPTWPDGHDEAGWTEVAVDADPTTAIPLADETTFRAWLRVGSVGGRATGGWSAERREEFARDLMAAAPRDADGAFFLPFGTIYLTATNR